MRAFGDLVVAKRHKTEPEKPAMRRISGLSLVRNSPGIDNEDLSVESLEERLVEDCRRLQSFALQAAGGGPDGLLMTFKAFEESLFPMVFAVARTVTMLFLAAAERTRMGLLPERMVVNGRRFRRAQPTARNLTTRFGVVRYLRSYMREDKLGTCRGFHPLDQALGLTSDRLSFGVLALAVRLATRMSFADARMTMSWFQPSPPSVEVIEQSVLGLGRFTEDWFCDFVPPDGDGDVLVIMIDSKGAPTATATELERRRGKRKPRAHGPSARHRGRSRRKRHPKKVRRKKGDKSKNAKMATLFVMYSLRREDGRLLGPIHRRIYASFAPKKHAFILARREADKRGFTRDSGKTVQVVTDGDNDLAVYTAEFFPEAIHTIDIMHVIEKLWEAATAVHREGSEERKLWVEEHRQLLYDGKAAQVADSLQHDLDAVPKTGPGNKYKRKKLSDVVGYIRRRLDKMNYDELIEDDLEIGSGAVEGAIKHVIGKRFDHGGMRWIKERAEALLQLRCIEINGDWDSFIRSVHEKIGCQQLQTATPTRLQQKAAAELPKLPESKRKAA